jgi:hypothetical protein
LLSHFLAHRDYYLPAEWRTLEQLERLREALTVLKVMPDSPERDARELALRQSALVVLLLVGGAAPETIEAARSAIALARRSGNFSQL